MTRDREVTIGGETVGYVWRQAIAPRRYVFSADPSGALYQKHVSGYRSGPRAAWDLVECDDLDLLIAFIEADGALDQCEVVRLFEMGTYRVLRRVAAEEGKP